MNAITAKVVSILVLLSVPTRSLQDHDGLFHKEFYHRMEQTLTQLCPKVDICDRNKTEPTVSPNGLIDGSTTYISCCKGCSCHERCHENLNCCFQPENATTNTTKECMYVQTKIADPTNVPAYRIVSSAPVDGCKPDSNCPALTKKGLTGTCDASPRLRPWGGLFPVYSVEKDDIYKNELCACCHGVGKYVPMQAYLVCGADPKTITSFAKHLSSLESDDFNESHCYVTFRYPNPAVFERYRCFIDTTSTCQSTKTFRVTPSLNLTTGEVVEACERGPHSPFEDWGRSYKNVFCGICNGRQMKTPKRCRDHSSEKLTSERHGIVFMLDSDHYQGRSPVDKSQKKLNNPQACRGQNEAPEMLDRCRDIFCPSGQVRHPLGHCVFTSRVLLDGDFTVFVKLQYMSKGKDLYTLLLEENITDSDIHGSLQESSPWPKRWSISRIYHDVSEVHEERYLFVTLVCTISELSVLYRDVVKSLDRPWEFILNRTPYMAQQNLSPYYLFAQSPPHGLYYPVWSLDLEKTETNISLSTSHGYYVLKKIYTMSASRKPIPLSKLFVCEQVAIQSDEHFLMADNKIIVSNLTTRVLFSEEFELVPNGKEKMTVRVCREDSVFKARKATGNSSQFPKGKANFILIIATIFFLGL